MNKIRCLIIDEMYPNLVELLKRVGVNADYEPAITRSQLLSRIAGYEGLIVRSKTNIDREVLARADKLKFIARAGAGIDNIDEEECAKKEIAIVNAPEANRDAVAEHALGMLLSISNNIHLGNQQVRSGVWDREGNRGWEVFGKTIGIIGFGNMGQAFASRLTGLHCQVVAYDKYKSGFGSDTVKEVDIETLFERCDVLSLHVPLTSDTRQMVNLEFLNRFKKPIVLINTARGRVVVLRDLLEALNTGKVKAAALDVLENENLNELSEEEQEDFRELTNRANVLLTPHVAGWSFESYEKINQILVRKIDKLLKN